MMKKILFLQILLLCVLLNSCRKSVTPHSSFPRAFYSVRMTDGGAPYEKVNIDLQGVQLWGSWKKPVLLDVRPGIYNMLDYANGIDTLIASGWIEGGVIQEICLILGPRNSVMVDSQSYPLHFPEGGHLGLRVKVHQLVRAGNTYSTLLDFKAQESVLDMGNKQFYLKPVIRTIIPGAGSISGIFELKGVMASVTATDGLNSYYSNVDIGGNFLLENLPPGNYNVYINPGHLFKTIERKGVAVQAGKITDLGIVTLQ